MVEFISSTLILLFCACVLIGMILQANDEEKAWRAKKDYEKMRKFIEENDSSQS